MGLFPWLLQVDQVMWMEGLDLIGQHKAICTLNSPCVASLQQLKNKWLGTTLVSMHVMVINDFNHV